VNIQGHETSKATLRQLTAHTLLFCGPSGVGRRGVAKWYTAWLNCAQSNPTRPTNEPCWQCKSCHLFLEDAHPDYTEIAPQLTTSTGRVSRRPEIKISQLVQRDGETDGVPLGRWLEPRPTFKKRVGVIDSADTLNMSAANAFLKTLEEPPSHAIIILLAPSPQAVLPTIASRSTVIRFGTVPLEHSQHPTAMLGRLGDILTAQENPERFNELLQIIDTYLQSLDKGLENAFEAADALEKAWTNENTFDVAELLTARLRECSPSLYANASDGVMKFEEALAAYAAPALAMQVLTLELRQWKGMSGE
jgi:DNA polymerase III subunit delta'